MAMCRLNVPAIFIYSGSILPGTFKGRPVTIRMSTNIGQLDRLHVGRRSTLEQNACPSAGACGAQFTANTMATVSGRGLGAALFGRRAGALRDPRQVLHACRRNGRGADRQGIRPRDIVTRKALENGDRGRGHRQVDPRRITSRPSPMNAASSSIFSTWLRSSKDTVYRGFEAVRPLCRQRHVQAGGIPLLMRTLLTTFCTAIALPSPAARSRKTSHR